MGKKKIVQKKETRDISGFFVFGSFLLFLFFQARHIVAGDSGDLVTAAATFGVPHPPGYPLYTFAGWIATKVFPWFGPAWAVGLLSSLPHALVVGFVSRIVYRITKSAIGACFAALLLVGNYLFFLYATTAEVFALFVLFLVGLLYLAIRWDETEDYRFLLLGTGVFGLALTHHHVILFLVPALAIYGWHTRRMLARVLTIRRALLAVGLFFLGLAPYLYVLVAARSGSMVNWDHVTTPARFIQLITRADYGTFQSGALIGSQLSQRFISVVAYARFLLLDFSWMGVSIAALGFISLWQKKRALALLIGTALVSLGPLFFFYASFPLANRFTLGTYERFLLPSYTLIALLFGVGIAAGGEVIPRVLKRYLRPPSMTVLRYGLAVVVAGFIGITGWATLWRFWGLAHDTTAERIGVDLLRSVPENSLVLVSRDTTLFTTQYVRYALSYRPDTVVLHLHALAGRDYQETVARAFPDIIIPAKNENFFETFILENMDAHPIFTNSPFAVGEAYVWVPQGLLYQLMSKDSAPTASELREQNDAIWAAYQDPARGLLSRYNHLMLADVRDVYASAHVALGKVYLQAHTFEEAASEFTRAVELHADTVASDAYTYLGVTKLFQKDCEAALAAFDGARKASFSPDSLITLYEGITYQDCLKDVEKGKALIEAFEKHEQERETPLDPSKAGAR